jgi:ankyrin repeat protein
MEHTTLEQAISNNDADQVRAVLSQGTDPNGETENCHLPLFLAAWRSGELVKILLEAGALPTLRDRIFQETALHYAKSYAAALPLLAAGADVNAVSMEGRTPLQAAAATGDVRLVKELLKRGAAPNPKSHPFSPLHTAVEGMKTKVVEVLLEAGADPNTVAMEGITPLMTAARSRRKQSAEIIKMLVAAGADPNAQQGQGEGRTPLWWAAVDGTADVVNAILASGASIDKETSRYGGTALTSAVYEKRADTAAALLAAGADPDARFADNHPDSTRRGYSARDLGAVCRNKEIQALFPKP